MLSSKNVIVNFYTSNYQEVLNKYLLPSLTKIGFNSDAFYCKELDNFNKWVNATNYKSEFLLECHEMFPDCNILWIDADAKVHQNPFNFLNSLNGHIGVGRYKKEVLSGTLWLPITNRRLEILSHWNEKCQKQQNTWDQKNLSSTIKNIKGLKIDYLPPEYCFIYDLSKRVYKNTKPIIEHFQASREYNNDRIKKK